MKNQYNRNFLKGQWLIRKWNYKSGCQIDLAKFEEKLAPNERTRSDFYEDKFIHSNFYRFNNDKLEYIAKEEDGIEIPYEDDRMEFNWRVATKKEITKYSYILFNEYSSKIL